METLDDQVLCLTGSRRWKIGDALVNLPRKALRKPREPVVTQQMDKILGRFRTWREADDALEDTSPTRKEEI
jgi:hypothetical protein